MALCVPIQTVQPPSKPGFDRFKVFFSAWAADLVQNPRSNHVGKFTSGFKHAGQRARSGDAELKPAMAHRPSPSFLCLLLPHKSLFVED